MIQQQQVHFSENLKKSDAKTNISLLQKLAGFLAKLTLTVVCELSIG